MQLRQLIWLCGIAVTGISCGSESPTAPDPNVVALVVVSAPANTITIGKTLSLSAQAINAAGVVVSGKTFKWVSSAPNVATVGSDGVVTPLSLGAATISASVDGKIGGTAITVVAQTPSTITFVSGAGESGSVGTFIGPKDPAVKVLDASGAPVAGVSITFTPSNGGAVSSTAVATDASGIAAVRWQFGLLPAQQTLRADAGALSATLTGSAQASFKVLAGNGQSTIAGTFIGPSDPSVQLLHLDGTPVAGASVQFVPSGDGAVSASTVTTNSAGTAAARWQLATVAGTNTLIIRAGDSTAIITATGTPLPAKVTKVGIDPPGVAPGGSYSDSIRVQVTDQAGNPTSGATVTFAVTSGGGSVSPASAQTDVNGRAAAKFILGRAAGGNAATATVTGIAAVTFTATTTPLVWSAVPSGTTQLLRGIWGSSTSNVWAVGIGVISHFDGASWSLVSAPTFAYSGVWGSSASNVWAVGDVSAIAHYDGTSWSLAFGGNNSALSNLRSVWGSSASDVWAVGANGLIVHYDGTAWSGVASPTAKDLSGVWGSSSSDVWAVGNNNETILHYNGVSWSVVSSGTTATLNYGGIWGSSGSDVWSTSYYSTFSHYDGTSWSPSSTPTTQELFHGIWGSARGDVWAVGYGGIIIHFDGASWSSRANALSGTNQELYAVWGTSSSNAWIVGASGTILHGQPPQ